MAEDDSWQAVIKRASVRAESEMRAKLVTFANGFSQLTYQEWTQAVHVGLDYASRAMAAKRNILHGMGEDQLTAVVLSRMEGYGFDATMQVVNGNCDVVIKMHDYVWLGEAKLDNSASHILGGYSQLTSRYAVGLDAQDHGGMLIYCTNEDMNKTMEMWQAAMPDSGISVVNKWDSANLLSLVTQSVIQATGRPFSVVHVPFALLHSPQDASITISPKASAAARKAKAAAKPGPKVP